MKTDAVRWTMENGGLNASRMTCFPSRDFAPSEDEGPRIEQFVLNAPDGSSFLVQITKLKHESQD